MDPVLIAAGVIVLVSAARGAARVARRWAVSEVARVVAEVLDQQSQPAGWRQSLLRHPVPRAERLTGWRNSAMEDVPIVEPPVVEAVKAEAPPQAGRELAEELHHVEYPGLVRFLLLNGASWNEAQDAA